MKLDVLRAYLCSKQSVIECTPYGRQTLVYKVNGEVCALIGWLDNPVHLTLKCDPDRALLLRDMYDAVQPSTFMNRRHWNTIALDGALDDATIQAMVDEALQLVMAEARAATIPHG